MSSIKIPCTKCGAFLKLPGPEYLGRKARCSQCKHRFVLELPDEVELHLAEPQSPAPLPRRPGEPLVGTSPRWVPDDVANVPPASPDMIPTANPASPKSPAAKDDFNLPPMARPLDFGTPDPPRVQAALPPAPTQPVPLPEIPNVVPPPVATGDQQSITARIKTRRRRNRAAPVAFGIVTAIFAFVMLGVWWYSDRDESDVSVVVNTPPQRNAGFEAQQRQQADSDADVKRLSPTSGEPIPLSYFAFTPHLIFHLRPAELWAGDPDRAEFRALLSSEFIGWLEGIILDVTRCKPQEIAELTIAVNFAARGTEADVGAVVRLKDAPPRAELLQKLGGRLRPDLQADIYEAEEFAYLIADERTFAVAPVSMSDSLAAAKEYAPLAPVDLQPLLLQSDRQRHITLLFDIVNIDVHRPDIFIPQLQPVADQFVLWFGKDVQTVSWSFHLDKRYFFMETLLHQSNESSPARVQRYAEAQLQKLPEQMFSLVQRMRPATVGSQKLIGRFPAMLAAMTLGTTSHVGSNYVRLVTLLPDTAAANLAAAATLTWNQSVVTDFSTPAPAVAAGAALPETVAERLRMPILVDFRRTPLQDAFAYIGEEIKMPIHIIGADLELAGITQVMAQTFNLGEVPALQAIDAILKQYDGVLVITVDEASKSITLTTRVRAEERGDTIHETSQ